MKFFAFLLIACLVSAIHANEDAQYTIEVVLRNNPCGSPDGPVITPTQLTTPPPALVALPGRSVLDTQALTFEADGVCRSYYDIVYSTISFNGTYLDGSFGAGSCIKRSSMAPSFVSIKEAATSGTPICKNVTTSNNGYEFQSVQITPVKRNMTPPSSASTIVPSVLVLMALLGALLVMF